MPEKIIQFGSNEKLSEKRKKMSSNSRVGLQRMVQNTGLLRKNGVKPSKY